MTGDWAGLALLLAASLAAGSFLNVAIHRLPIMLARQWQAEARQQLGLGEEAAAAEGRDAQAEQSSGLAAGAAAGAAREAPFNLFLPRSRCPACKQRIEIQDNIPILSWLLLKGRCRHCAERISVRYPLVEALAAGAALAATAVFGFTWEGFAAAACAWALIALAGIDLDEQLLPDQITLPLLWAGLIVNAIGGFADLPSAVAGAVAGYLFLWAIYWAFKLITGREGMGYGDFKLFAALGAWLGWQDLPLVILLAAAAGLAWGLAGILAGRRDRRQPIPFGPFLAFAGWAVLLFGDWMAVAPF